MRLLSDTREVVDDQGFTPIDGVPLVLEWLPLALGEFRFRRNVLAESRVGMGAMVIHSNQIIEIHFDNHNPIIDLPVHKSTGIRTQWW